MNKRFKSFVTLFMAVIMVFVSAPYVSMVEGSDRYAPHSNILANLSDETQNCPFSLESQHMQDSIWDDVIIAPITAIESIAEISNQYTSLGAIQKTFISAIDDSPFYAFFNPATGVVTMYSMDGMSKGERYVSNREGFEELARVNAEATIAIRGSIAAFSEIDRTDYNVPHTDVTEMPVFDWNDTGTATFFAEEHTEFFHDPRTFMAEEDIEFLHEPITFMGDTAITPFFDTGSIRVRVPYGVLPNPRAGQSVFAGGLHDTTINHGWIELWAFSFPIGMRVLDAYFTNAVGDDSRSFLDIGQWGLRRHPIRFRGESYGVRVSSPSGAFDNVELRVFARNIDGTIGTTGQPPSAPRNFRNIDVTSSGVTLEWTAPISGSAPITYVVRSFENGAWHLRFQGTSLGVEFINMPSNTTITFDIRAQNASGSSAAVTQTITTLPASFTTFNLTYNANGGTGTNMIQRFTTARSLSIRGNPFSHPQGLAFAGWNTAANGTGTHFSPGQTTTFAAGNRTLFAQWRPRPPSRPGTPFSMGRTETTITLRWEASSGTGSITYYIFMDGWDSPRWTGTGTTATITGLEPNLEGIFRVRARNAGGHSSLSLPGTAHTARRVWLNSGLRILSISGNALNFHFRHDTPENIRVAVRQAAQDWRVAVPGINFAERPQGQAHNMVYFESRPHMPITYGYVEPIPFMDQGVMTNFNIFINSYQTGRSQTFYRAVAGHEFGHVLGLGHVINTNMLMDPARNREQFFTPQSGDIQGVRAIWHLN